jgi:LmbE family N-acetylglucosaminyl deacetylase
MNVLVIAPHPDDESIGCGGTICLHTNRGDKVTTVFLTSGELALKHLSPDEAWKIREAEAEAAAAILGVSTLKFLRRPDWFVSEMIEETAAILKPILEKEDPELIYLPHEREAIPDHEASLAIVRSALSGSELAEKTHLITYEVWTPLPEYDHVEDITPVMRRKLKALRCHRSQIGYFRYDRAVRGLNQYRGELAARCRYAEVFQTAYVNPS